jgi:hypothetical protein
MELFNNCLRQKMAWSLERRGFKLTSNSILHREMMAVEILTRNKKYNIAAKKGGPGVALRAQQCLGFSVLKSVLKPVSPYLDLLGTKAGQFKALPCAFHAPEFLTPMLLSNRHITDRGWP